jgi:hypothetical protein
MNEATLPEQLRALAKDVRDSWSDIPSNGHYPEYRDADFARAAMYDSLADTVDRLQAQRDEANKQADMLAHRNAVLVVELDELRKRYLEVRDRNTRLLSQMQELEAREQ